MRETVKTDRLVGCGDRHQLGPLLLGLSALGAQLNKFHLDTRAALVVTVGRLLTARAGRRFLTKLNEDFKLIHFYNAA